MKNCRLIIALTTLLAGTSIAYAEEATPQANPEIKGYLECINTETKKQTEEGSDKINDAQLVIDACSKERQSLLDSIDPSVAQKMIDQVEKHLKSRVRSD